MTCKYTFGLHISFYLHVGAHMLAVDIVDFRRQRPAWFHKIKVIIMPNSLILTSSISFGEYLNAGTTCMKFGQNGENPGWPAYPPCNLGSSLVRVLMSANTSQSNVVLYKMHKPRLKGLSHDKNQVLNWLEVENTSVDWHVGGTEGRGGTTPGRPA